MANKIITLNDLLDAAAAEGGSRTSLVMGDEKISFDELRGQVLRVAAGWAAWGLKPGQTVAILHRNSPHFITAYFALNRLGCVAVPINFMVSKPEELAFMLKDCGAAGIVTQREFLKGARGAAALVPSLRGVWVSDQDPADARPGEAAYQTLAGDSGKVPAVPMAAEDTAAILYTSGTTGSPKGVMLTHRNMVTNCEASIRRMEINSSDVALCLLPMFHTFAWTGNVLMALRARVKLVIISAVAPPKPWLSMMAKHGVSLFSAVPQVYSVLAKEAVGIKGLVLKWWFFRRVRIAICGAAPLSPAVQKAFEDAFGVPILQGYGLTETSPVATLNSLERHKIGSVGTPIDGVQVKILGEDGKELPVGQEGEICIKGDNIMKGYYNLPEATSETFTADGFFKSGDIGAVDDEGFVYIRDRKKDMIIIKGLKVFSAQVEATLLEHPDVAEAAVIGIPDEHHDETIKAFMVLKPGSRADKAALVKYCREKFDAYKRPRDIEIVDALPKNALQKVLKRVLRDQELKKKAGAPA